MGHVFTNIIRIQESTRRADIPPFRSRFSTVNADMTPSHLNPITRGRRELYGSLPFVSAFGMSHHERAIHDIINKESKKSFTDIEVNFSILGNCLMKFKFIIEFTWFN